MRVLRDSAALEAVADPGAEAAPDGAAAMRAVVAVQVTQYGGSKNIVFASVIQI